MKISPAAFDVLFKEKLLRKVIYGRINQTSEIYG